MSDLELMELAAKAAGIAVRRGRVWQSDMLFREIPRPSSPLVSNVEWNPLADDGDALRLAVKLAMYVALDNAAREVVACAAEGSVVKERCGDDPYAATRRAIVRAAAEIGQQMGGGNAE